MKEILKSRLKEFSEICLNDNEKFRLNSNSCGDCQKQRGKIFFKEFF